MLTSTVNKKGEVLGFQLLGSIALKLSLVDFKCFWYSYFLPDIPLSTVPHDRIAKHSEYLVAGAMSSTVLEYSFTTTGSVYRVPTKRFFCFCSQGSGLQNRPLNRIPL